jgi:hypothetical protein
VVMCKLVVRLLGVIIGVTLFAAGVSAQTGTTISGTVKDTSGAVLPGVTVEVASPH